jgi:hypothetical protein
MKMFEKVVYLKPARTGSTLLAVLAVMILIPFSYAQSASESSDWQSTIERVMGMKGQTMPEGVLRFDLPRNDRKTVVAGLFAQPNLVTDGYVAYKQESGKTLMAGELVLLEKEVDPVVEVLRRAVPLGISIDALHNHVIEEQPRWLYVHFTGFGDAKTVATVVEAALRKTSAPRTNDDNKMDADDVIKGFDADKVEAILGGDSTIVDRVLEVSIPCSGTLTYAGHDFPSAMGPESELHFQSLGNGNAVAAPEICVRASKVTAVVEFLKQNGFTVSAIHNHWTKENPRVFFIHGWRTGNAEHLANILKQAIEITR